MGSPFHISHYDQVELEHNEAFSTMREQLRRQECGMERPSFCAGHRLSCTPDEQETYRFHRDIIHTLLVPLFLINHQAERTAARTLPSQKGAEPERAFRGEARSAFAWLNCILTEEHDWYLTARCPACIVQHVLHSEPTIRFVTVASQLAGARSGFQCWLAALETAVCEDPFWGDAFWPDIEERASRLTDGVRQLVRQCYELTANRESPHVPLAKTSGSVYANRSATCTIPLKPSSFARKQVRLTREEQRYRSSLWTCSEMRQPLAGCTTAPKSRRRSLTS
ncbi:unnamed protein product [Penicillium salamii]|uniref:Uncharacterized protein n=1 Tax=Penicillium salamii TaxID=1612424 RepID=A0A9W4IJA8_9EURO|nr:unnamed protein product [Penicillium salamii]CAG8183549.1 unnamed protein product [Penicillium salamii]CAG8239048.1 unnamed protein product [Penicillium salamii]CAG8242430.1 unnamed protein product [Penicillium salamii]CAG8246461.1 unnamed protein product [Penicillium salamii]